MWTLYTSGESADDITGTGPLRHWSTAVSSFCKNSQPLMLSTLEASQLQPNFYARKPLNNTTCLKHIAKKPLSNLEHCNDAEWWWEYQAIFITFFQQVNIIFDKQLLIVSVTTNNVTFSPLSNSIFRIGTYHKKLMHKFRFKTSTESSCRSSQVGGMPLVMCIMQLLWGAASGVCGSSSGSLMTPSGGCDSSWQHETCQQTSKCAHDIMRIIKQ